MVTHVKEWIKYVSSILSLVTTLIIIDHDVYSILSFLKNILTKQFKHHLKMLYRVITV